jgi:hypothetical protein
MGLSPKFHPLLRLNPMGRVLLGFPQSERPFAEQSAGDVAQISPTAERLNPTGRDDVLMSAKRSEHFLCRYRRSAPFEAFRTKLN